MPSFSRERGASHTDLEHWEADLGWCVPSDYKVICQVERWLQTSQGTQECFKAYSDASVLNKVKFPRGLVVWVVP